MTAFNGFPDGKVRFTPIPGPFFSELLPEIDHLGELKVTLYFLWRLDRMEGNFRYLRPTDFQEDARLMQGLGKDLASACAVLAEALERAVLRGALLKAEMEVEGQIDTLYFLNSARGRAAVAAIQDGSWRPIADPQAAVVLTSERPNIFRLYEENIGPLTPMIAEDLRDAEGTYPEVWIEEAIHIAVENNKRSWRYVAAILRRWQEGGKDEQYR